MELICITGPMFSGKTTELLRLLRIHMIAGKKTLLIKHSNDNRSSFVETHDGISYPSISVLDIESIRDIILEQDVIGIDEGQFFKGLFSFIQDIVDKKIIIIVAGLTISFNYKILFNEMVNVSAISNKCVRLLAVCEECKCYNAVYSHNKTLEKTSGNVHQVIGGKESYRALCRECYFSN